MERFRSHDELLDWAVGYLTLAIGRNDLRGSLWMVLTTAHEWFGEIKEQPKKVRRGKAKK